MVLPNCLFSRTMSSSADREILRDWMEKVRQTRNAEAKQTVHKCSSCGQNLTENEAKNMPPNTTRRCDSCVLDEIYSEEEDVDDSQDQPTELKLNPAPSLPITR